MAKARPLSDAALAARRMSGADLLVARWALIKAELFNELPKGAHWESCPPDASLCKVAFSAATSGGCPTCAFSFSAIDLRISCSCGGRHKDVTLDINYLDLPRVLDELVELARAEGLDGRAAHAARDDLEEGVRSAEDARVWLDEQIDADRARYYDSLDGLCDEVCD